MIKRNKSDSFKKIMRKYQPLRLHLWQNSLKNNTIKKDQSESLRSEILILVEIF